MKCVWCNKVLHKPTGAVNRALSIGAPLYCDRKCAGLGHRKGKTKVQKVEEKSLYDKKYRAKNFEILKDKKAAYFKRTYDPKQAAIKRKKNMARHVEYCRHPEYKRYKREYDRKLRASEYGPFADSYILVINLNREIKSRASNYEIRTQNKTFAKTQQRRREEGIHDRIRHSKVES